MQPGTYRIIPVKAKTHTVFALVSPEDYEALARHKWHLSNRYAVRHTPMVNGRRSKVSMHREILELAKGSPLEGDHINRDRLDNRRPNLRVVTRAINGRNVPGDVRATSRYRGVHWNTRCSKWHSGAVIDGKRTYLGSSSDERVAAGFVNAFWVERGYAAPNDLSS